MGADKYCINKIKLVKTNVRDQERGYSEYMRNTLLKNFLGVTTSEHGMQVVQDGARGALLKDACQEVT